MPDAHSTDATTVVVTAPAVPPTPIPIPPGLAPATRYQLSRTEDILLWAETASVIISAIFGGSLGKSLLNAVGKLKAAKQTTQVSQAGTSTTTVETPTSTTIVDTRQPTEPDLRIRQRPFFNGPNDEAESAWTGAAASRRAVKRVNQARGDQTKSVLAQEELDKLHAMNKLIASLLSQRQRDLFREVVCHIPTAELQVQFWLDLSDNCGSKEQFLCFMKVHGIIRDPSEFTQELGKSLVAGMEQSNKIQRDVVTREGVRLDARSDAALAKHKRPPTPTNDNAGKPIWLVRAYNRIRFGPGGKPYSSSATTRIFPI